MKPRLLLDHRLERPYNMAATMSLLSLGPTDPTMQVSAERVQLVTWAATAPLEITVERTSDRIRALAVGDRADLDWAASKIVDWLGLEYHPPEPEWFAQGGAPLKRLAKRLEGLRLPRSPLLFSRLIQIVLQQLISFEDAAYGWRQLVQRHGRQHMPYTGLSVPPSAKALAQLATHQYVECSVLPQHGRRIVELAKRAAKLERVWNGGAGDDAVARTTTLLTKLRGIGPWTIGHIQGCGMAYSDAVTPGDYSLPHHVAHFFIGKERSNDEEMLQLLEPYRPFRFYVLALLQKGSKPPPRRGPRHRRLRDHMGT